MTILFQVEAEESGGYRCEVATRPKGSEDPQDASAARIAERALCVVLECLRRDQEGAPFLEEQKLARRLGEEFAGDPEGP
ncbi:MAG: hypothetical protein ACR2MW_03935 [Chthoniobacterales bacterium]